MLLFLSNLKVIMWHDGSILFSIRACPLIQTISLCEIKGKMSNLPDKPNYYRTVEHDFDPMSGQTEHYKIVYVASS
jgi:hypothetical protein